MNPRPFADRIWEKVDKNGPTMPGMNTPCWVWTGFRLRGYGKIGSGGKRGKILIAHRAAWEMSNGPVPDGLMVRHRCDNRACVRAADHLCLGTAAENSADMVGRGRSCRGARNWNSRLTEPQVEVIRYLRRNTTLTQADVGMLFGVSRSNIGIIENGLNWRVAA